MLLLLSVLFLGPASELTLFLIALEDVTGAGLDVVTGMEVAEVASDETVVVVTFGDEGGGDAGGTSSTEKSRSSRNWRASSALDLGLGAMMDDVEICVNGDVWCVR